MIAELRWPSLLSNRNRRRSCAGLLLTLALLWPLAGDAETLRELVETTPSGEPLALPAGKVLGRADIFAATTILGGGQTTLAAPEDDASLVVLTGADLRISGVDFVQEGAAKFAIYVDGGSLHLEDCNISGGFEVAIYVASGRLTVEDCQISAGLYGIQATPGSDVVITNVSMLGQGDTAIRADGAAVRLTDVTVADSGMNGVIVTAASAFVADGLTLSGILTDAIVAQDCILTDLRRVVVEVSGRALTASGGADFHLEGFVLAGGSGALALDGLTGDVTLMHGRMQSGEGQTTAAISDASGLWMDDVNLVGGETGLYLTGALPGAAFTRITLHSQTGTGLFMDAVAPATDGSPPPEFRDLRIISGATTFPAYFRDSGPVTFTRSAVLTTSTQPIGWEGLSAPVFAASTLISMPEWGLGSIAYEIEPGEPPRFIPFGDVAYLGEGVLGPGSQAITIADFAARAGIDPDFRRAIADFSDGLVTNHEVLGLALEYALPVADPDVAPKELALLALAPPEAGWVWDREAVRISLTGPDGHRIDVVPGDFPLSLAAGRYGLAVDGQPSGRIDVGDGSTLELALPEAPFYAWRDDQGRKTRGPTLFLRPVGELRQILAGFRPLRPGEYWGYTPAFAVRRGADRQAASDLIARFKADMPALLTEMETQSASEAWPAFNLNWQRIDMAMDILAQFGTREDARWLLSLALPPDVQIDNMETAVLIEMRLFALNDGAALPVARQRVADYLADGSAPWADTLRLLKALARSGLPEGLTLLAEFYEAQRMRSDTGQPVPTGVIELSRLAPDAAKDIPSGYLDDLTRAVATYLDGPLPEGTWGPVGTDQWNAAAAALAHEAVFAPPGTPQRRMAIPVDAFVGAAAWLFADPVVMLRGRLALTGPADPDRLEGWQYRVPENLCAALAYRTPAARAAILAEMREQVITAVAFAFASNEEKVSPETMAGRMENIGFALDIILGECVLSDAVVQNFGRNAAGEDAALFDNLEYEPLWWHRLPRARAALDYFGSGADYPDLRGLSVYSPADLQAILAAAPAGDPALQTMLLARHALISDAFQTDFDSLNFGAEHRQFRLRNAGGDGSVTVAGYLDIRPILDGERLIVAIRHRIQSPDYGGLAAMITEPDRAPFEADNRFRMFDAVTLDKAGLETAMTFEGASPGGILYFSAPWTGDLSDTALHLNMRFWDATWDIDLPLWASSLAFAQRAQSALPMVAP